MSKNRVESDLASAGNDTEKSLALLPAGLSRMKEELQMVGNTLKLLTVFDGLNHEAGAALIRDMGVPTDEFTPMLDQLQKVENWLRQTAQFVETMRGQLPIFYYLSQLPHTADEAVYRPDANRKVCGAAP